jgi:hypothetical protein
MDVDDVAAQTVDGETDSKNDAAQDDLGLSMDSDVATKDSASKKTD